MKDIIFQTVYSHDEAKMKTVLDYHLQVRPLKKEDTVFLWAGTDTNYSLGGFELKLHRNSLLHIAKYYLTSGLMVIVSWVRLLNYYWY